MRPSFHIVSNYFSHSSITLTRTGCLESAMRNSCLKKRRARSDQVQKWFELQNIKLKNNFLYSVCVLFCALSLYKILDMFGILERKKNQFTQDFSKPNQFYYNLNLIQNEKQKFHMFKEKATVSLAKVLPGANKHFYANHYASNVYWLPKHSF